MILVLKKCYKSSRYASYDLPHVCMTVHRNSVFSQTNYSQLGFFVVLTRKTTKNHSTRQRPNTKHHTSAENQAMDMEVLIQ